jgi:uncharacterized protein YbjT (DUF2867 family)
LPPAAVLVTGASGPAGGYMLAHLIAQGGWDIVFSGPAEEGASNGTQRPALDIDAIGSIYAI